MHKPQQQPLDTSRTRRSQAQTPVTLDTFLPALAGASLAPGVVDTILAIADVARDLSARIGLGALEQAFGATAGSANRDGDQQKALDLIADQAFEAALRKVPVAFLASEEREMPVALDADGRRDAWLAVAIDPLDGSSNIDTNVSIGSIFSILPAGQPQHCDPEVLFLQPGREQLAAGFIIYGPQTTLVLTIGHGVQTFTLDRRSNSFRLACEQLQIGSDSSEYAINASNYRHWDDPVRALIDDYIKGEDGPHRRNFNMRWIASLVADAYRVLQRGGLFLYPRDQRSGYRNGRLRLVYEANPIAMLVEQAGGQATDAHQRLLDVVPVALHQRTPLVFGSPANVDTVRRYHQAPDSYGSRSPLFGRRGLLRI